MITLEQAIPGTEVTVNGDTTTILTGHYVEERLGLMIKTSKFPGGYPADKHEPVGTKAVAVQPITFEISIIEKEDPVKLTVALVTDKLKPLYDLKIDNYLDEAGYSAVKAGKNKAVKARTAIQAKEKDVIAAIKATHATELAKVTDYTAELYKVCLDAQNDLQGKMDKADKERTAEANRLAEEKKARTEARDNKMFALGMKFNGKGFMEYGKYIDQEVLHAMAEDKYIELLVEIEGLQMEQGITGKESIAIKTFSSGMNPDSSPSEMPAYGPRVMPNAKVSKREYPTAVYEREVEGLRIIITKETVEGDSNTLVSNDRILNSYYYLQIVK